jgi:hydrogenase maturation protease
MTARPLVIAYGNRLRGDDAVGWVVADSLANDIRMQGVDVVALHQLSPELADDVARASRVVFVDARIDPATAPGAVGVAQLKPDSAASSMTHHVDAGTVLALAKGLYGQTTPAYAVTVTIESAEAGAPLGLAVNASVSALVEAVAALCLEAADA